MKKGTKLRCIVVDDELLAINLLKGYIDNCDNLDCLGSFNNAITTRSFLRKNQVDLMFLDIEMPELNGIQLVRSMKDGPKIIFTTAYDHFAVESYNLEAVDYLLKPISFERFLKAVDKVCAIPSRDHQAKEIDIGRPFAYFKSNHEYHKVFFDEIEYIESLRNYLKLVTSEEEVIIYQAISEMERKLPDSFIRIHRSFIVNRGKVKRLSKTSVVLTDHTLPIGGHYKDTISSFFQNCLWQ